MKKQVKNKKQSIFSLLVILVGFGLGFLYAHYSKKQLGVPITEGILWPSPPRLNEFFLADKNDNPFTLEDFKGKWSIIFFGFANCPDICPSTLVAMTKAEGNLRAIPEFGESGLLVFVSVDPVRDTPDVLKTYISHFSPRIRAVTGAETELEILTKSVGAIFLKLGGDSKNYTIDHSAGLFFVSPEGYLFSVLTPPIVDHDIVSRFTKIVGAYRSLL